ncbi:hypothetical protein, partial [Salmonella enterica]|uniref:hypothetical protein n=1 Tax=Salmonella enterica TaxID=28901 RepID=UPI000AD5E675
MVKCVSSFLLFSLLSVQAMSAENHIDLHHIAGEKNTFKNKGDIDVSLNGTGALVSGDMSQVTLDGDINVVSVQDSEGVFSSATGVNVSGDSNAVDITGNV